MNRSFRVGVTFEPQHTTYASFAAAVRQVEQIGVDTLWTWDHFFPMTGDPQGAHFEAWTLLTAMAMLTTRAEIGCLVTSNSYRNPNLLADMSRTLDHISAGRLILGIGAGWMERDYQEYGFPFGTPIQRLRALEKNLPVIQGRWQKLSPPPTRKIPLLIGGGGEKFTLRLVSEYADIWNGFGPAEAYARKNKILDQWCQKTGRSPNEIERSVTLQTSEVPAALEGFAGAGATHFILRLSEPWDFPAVEALVRWKETQSALPDSVS